MRGTRVYDPAAPNAQHRPTTLATSAYERLRSDIVSGMLQPGDKLRIESLRRRYAVGTAPLREALSRLAAERLALREDQRGFRVAAVSQADLLELTQTRCWLESTALRESIRHGGLEWEESVLLAFHRLSREPRTDVEDFHATKPEWEARHRAFHHALIAACGSRWLLHFCRQLHDQANRYRNLAHSISFPDRDSLAEHEGIMRSAINRQAEEAVGRLETHYRRTTDVIIQSEPARLEDGTGQPV